jgi:hypothetical protein
MLNIFSAEACLLIVTFHDSSHAAMPNEVPFGGVASFRCKNPENAPVLDRKNPIPAHFVKETLKISLKN